MNWLSKEWFQLYGGTERDGPARKALEAGGGGGGGRRLVGKILKAS